MPFLPQLSYAERLARAADKQSALLVFLSSGEVYTTTSIVASLLALSERRATACLAALERAGAIKSEMHHIGGRLMRIYGITAHGAAISGRFDAPIFELGRTNPSWISHRLDGQRLRLAAEASGWREWKPERALRASGLKKVPDAVTTSPVGEVVAIEVERHCKTPKRYSEILVAYLQEIKAGRYSSIHFVCPAGISQLVAGAFQRIDKVKFQGEVVKIEQKHRDRFQFFDFQDWPPTAAEKAK